ncbi:MAG TPA: HK97-gp10 family putative phage morphogenesis protein [Gemmatimonadales bacterium]|nr:HK97-gp10 family putative phage morphogenesis protein [Gemmatimonadales bacterium]
MADSMSLRVEGLRELRQSLRELGPQMSERVLSGALRAAAADVEAEIRSRAPVASARHRRGKQPGELLRSIRTTVEWQSSEEARVSVGPRVPYGHLVEAGHAIVPRGPTRRGRKLGKEGRARLRALLKARQASGAIGRAQARPFVGPAWEATKDRVVETFKRAVIRTVEEIRALHRIGARNRGSGTGGTV